jgi:hypothetical protein
MSLRRLAPLSGIAFVVLTFVAFVPVGGKTPGIKDSPEKIASFYSKHHSKESAAAYILAIGVGFLAVFVSSCRPLIRDAHRLWSTLFFGGGIIAAVGFLVAGGIHVALADGANHGVDPVALQALNALDADDYLAFGIGVAIMLLGAAGALIPRQGVLKWFGWAALVLGILSFTPLGFIGFLGAGIWVLIVSWLLFQRGDASAAEGASA